MAFFSLLLVLLSLTVLATEVLTPPRPLWRGWIPAVATLVLLFHLAVDGYRILLVPTYIILLWSLLHTVSGLLDDAERAEDDATDGEKRAMASTRNPRTVLIGVGAGAVLMTSLLSWVLNPVATVQRDITALLSPLAPRDFTSLPWVTAFDSTLATLGREYPYTAWKGIEWDSLRARTWPALAAAQARHDVDTYRSAIADFVRAIPDAGMTLTLRNPGSTPLAGTIGLHLTRADEGEVVVLDVARGSPADLAGLRKGDTILRWNDAPIDSALSAVPDSVTGHRAVTIGTFDAFALDALANPPPGARARLTLQDQRRLDVVAVSPPDPGEAVTGDSLPVSHRILPDSVGYLRVRSFAPTFRQWFPARAVRDAVRSFHAAETHGVVIDLRGDPTGSSRKLAAAYAAPFVTRVDLLEEMSLYQATEGDFVIDPRRTIRVHPRRPRWEGPLVVLVDRWCAGPCEGLAMLLSRLPGATVLGWTGTAGSFGLPGGTIDLPEGLRLRHPIGRSLDASGSIQLEVDSTGRGGVPTTRPPRTRGMLTDSSLPGTDVLLQEAHLLMHGTARDSLSSRAWRPAPDPDGLDRTPPPASDSNARAPDGAVSPGAGTGTST